MNHLKNHENPYLLLTPGPLSTSITVRRAMLRDWCTWDKDYGCLVQNIRKRIIDIAVKKTKNYTSVLMQGSGTFTVEAVVGSCIPEGGKLLVLANGAYGERIAQIAQYLKMDYDVIRFDVRKTPDAKAVEDRLSLDQNITHVMMVHCETTTGILNPLDEIGKTVKRHKKIFIVDAMSSFGGIPIDMEEIGIDFLISSSNKCVQGVPGFGFVVAKRAEIEKCKGVARSLSLDLFEQWKEMEEKNGKWRFTSPTHGVRAFYQALLELEQEGGVIKRHARYQKNHQVLIEEMRTIGFETLIEEEFQSPIITTFFYPPNKDFEFTRFYELLKEKGFVIYPGKLTEENVFRIGNIGDIYPSDMINLVKTMSNIKFW